MKKYIYIPFALVIFLFASVEKSLACSCVASLEPVKKQIEGAFTNSAAIFSGEVIEIKESPTNKYSVLIKLKVDKSWKGESQAEITIITAKDSAMCGYNFEVGKKYLVYANGKKDELSAYNCSRTTTFSNTGDAKYLDKLKRKKTNSK